MLNEKNTGCSQMKGRTNRACWGNQKYTNRNTFKCSPDPYTISMHTRIERLHKEIYLCIVLSICVSATTKYAATQISIRCNTDTNTLQHRYQYAATQISIRCNTDINTLQHRYQCVYRAIYVCILISVLQRILW